MLNNNTKLKEKNKEKNKKKSKHMNVVSIDLVEQITENEHLEKEKESLEKESLEKESLEKEKEKESLILEKERLAKEKSDMQINNIDLRYFANQNHNPCLKTNKLDQLLNNNYLLKDIYANIEENIATYKDQILKYNNSTLEKLIENNDDTKIINGEKYKLFYLLYILNLISHLKDKKIKNSIKEELKDFNNNNNYCDDASLSSFNIYNATLDNMCTKKQITNLDLFVVRKSSNAKRKILPQKRS
jgi:hypothetical protein